MRGSLLALAAAVTAAGAYVATGQHEKHAADQLVPESYVQEAQRQVDTFISWLRDEDTQPRQLRPVEEREDTL